MFLAGIGGVRTEHRVIVSKGPLADEIALHDNQTGEGFLPQPAILPQVDLVITHGGNNTETEALRHGKPAEWTLTWRDEVPQRA